MVYLQVMRQASLPHPSLRNFNANNKFHMTNQSTLSKAVRNSLIAGALLALPFGASAQAVIFPQPEQPGVAMSAADATEGTVVLSNDLLSATFVNADGKLSFGGCPELGLLPGTELFNITLGDNKSVKASDMKVESWEVSDLTADAESAVASRRHAGKQLTARLTYGDLEFEWRAVLRDGSHYLRTELDITANKDVSMHSVVPMFYEIENGADVPEVVGNTRGAVLASTKIFAGLETPTGLNSIVSPTHAEPIYKADEGFLYNGWLADTSNDDYQPSNPAYWTWTPGDQLPQAIKDLGFGQADVIGKRGFVEFTKAGAHEVTFQYSSGTHGLNIVGVDVVSAEGDIVASDYHIGFTGGESRKNKFSISVPEAGVYLVRYFVEIRTESNTSAGTITYSPAVKAATADTDPGTGGDEPETVFIQGLWSRHTTLKAGSTWTVSGVVGLIAPGQSRRSFLAYSERERAVAWRPFPIYNSWYELNIDRNNSPTYSGHMTSTMCTEVVNEWNEKLYKAHKANIQAFVWDDGWDEYGTWTFNRNFPNGFTEPDEAARVSGAGTGAWLGPVGGYGTSGDLRRAYWSSKGGMQLSNPAYYKTFLDACQMMIDNYDFRFFKLDGISAQFSSVGPDAGYTGEENAEGIIDIIKEVRKMRPDMFFNTTVGTWASPFWFHYTDAVWRQEADHSTVGNQGDDRERWITYRDRLVYQNFVQNSPLCPINTLMTHGVILTTRGDVSKTMNYDGVLRELRCAFACGSGMVELYTDRALLNSVGGGKLWADIAECIDWQKANADVLPDIHWVGGNPWDGSRANVYGWASWNGKKATLALRNPSASAQNFTFTMREVLDIPAYFTDAVYLKPSFEVQNELQGLDMDTAIDLDKTITVKLPASSVFVFDGAHSSFSSIGTIAADDAAEADQRVFDLMGRRCDEANLAPGIYIRGGKKFIVH